MIRNIALNAAMVVEVFLAVFLVYTPGVNGVVQMCPLK